MGTLPLIPDLNARHRAGLGIQRVGCARTGGRVLGIALVRFGKPDDQPVIGLLRLRRDRAKDRRPGQLVTVSRTAPVSPAPL